MRPDFTQLCLAFTFTFTFRAFSRFLSKATYVYNLSQEGNHNISLLIMKILNEKEKETIFKPSSGHSS